MSSKDQPDADHLDAEPSAEERAEAEALARALQAGAPAAAPPPEDALAAAALLRHARRAQDPGEPARDGARLAAAEARALAAVDKRRPRRRRWLLPALLVPASAAAALIVAVMPATRSRLAPVASSPVEPVIPKPPTTLLEAQAKAARAGGDLSALDRQMRDYRRAYYAALGSSDAEEP
jgi:hypothetical protein